MLPIPSTLEKKQRRLRALIRVGWCLYAIVIIVGVAYFFHIGRFGVGLTIAAVSLIFALMNSKYRAAVRYNRSGRIK